MKTGSSNASCVDAIATTQSSVILFAILVQTGRTLRQAWIGIENDVAMFRVAFPRASV